MPDRFQYKTFCPVGDYRIGYDPKCLSVFMVKPFVQIIQLPCNNILRPRFGMDFCKLTRVMQQLKLKSLRVGLAYGDSTVEFMYSILVISKSIKKGRTAFVATDAPICHLGKKDCAVLTGGV